MNHASPLRPILTPRAGIRAGIRAGWLAAIAVALTLAFSPASAQPDPAAFAPDAATAEATATRVLDRLLSAEWAVGDYEAHAKNLVAAIVAEPNADFVPFLLDEIERVQGWLADADLTMRPLDDIDVASLTNGWSAIALSSRQIPRAERFDRAAHADAYYARLPLIRDCRVLGPLEWRDCSALPLPLAPETAVDPLRVQSFPSPFGPRSWQPAPLNAAARRQFIARPDGERPAGAGFFVATQLVVGGSSPVHAHLIVNTREDFRVIANGQAIADSYAHFGVRPLPVSMPITLPPGRHTLMVKLVRDVFVRLMLADDDGNWPARVRVSIAPDSPTATADVIAGAPAPVGAWKAAENLLAAAPDSSAAQMLASIARRSVGLSDSAMRLAKQAHEFEQTPRSAWWFAQCLEANSDYPSALAHRESKALYEFALKTDAAFVPAHFPLAEEAMRTDRAELADQWLTKAAELAPENLRVPLDRRDIFRTKNLHHLENELMDGMREQAPWHPVVGNYFREYYENLPNLAAARNLVQERLQRFPSDISAVLSLIDLSDRMGDDPAKLAGMFDSLLEKHSSHEMILAAAATFFERHRDYARANQCIGRLLAQNSRDAGLYHERLGRNYLRLGQRETALNHLKLAIENSQGRHDLRRYLADLEGRNEDAMFDALAPDVDALLADAPSAEEFPGLAAIVLFDQEITRVYPDLSSVTDVAVVRKVLSPRGVALYGEQHFSGRLLEARVVQPDGESFEPTIVGQSLQMPRLAPGCVQIIRYRLENPAPFDGRFSGGQFLFTDPARVEMLRFTRYVFVAPADLKFAISANKTPVPAVTTDADTGLVTHTYEMRDSMPFDVREEFEPEFDEFAPWVEYHTPRPGWEAVYARLLNGDRPWLSPSSAVREKAVAMMGDLAEIPADAAARDARAETLARRAYEFVNSHVQEDGSGGATETLLTGQGNRLRLLMALLSAMNVRTQIVRASSADHATRIDFAHPDASEFTANLLRVRRETRPDILLFMDARLLPFGEIPQSLGGGLAIVAEPDECSVIFLPAADPFADARRSHVTYAIESGGRVAAEGTFTVIGVEGAGIKGQVGRMPDFQKSMVAQQMANGAVSGITLGDFEFADLDSRERPFVLRFAGEVSGLVQAAGQGELRVRNGLHAFNFVPALAATPTRQRDLVFTVGPLGFIDRVEWELGDGLHAAALPRSLAMHHPLISYVRTVSREGSRVVIERRVLLRPGRVTVEKYADFLAFCQRVDAAERDPLRLRQIKR